MNKLEYNAREHASRAMQSLPGGTPTEREWMEQALIRAYAAGASYGAVNLAQTVVDKFARKEAP